MASALYAGFLAIGGVWLGLLVASFGYYETYGDRDVGAWYQVKADALHERQERPKIVLAGGSNVLYGLDAAALEREFGMPCVNYGTHAAMPLDYMLDRWKRVLSPGDLLVISPEWAYLKRETNDMNDVFTGCMLAADSSYFWKMSWRDQAQVLLTTSFRRLMMPVFASFRENNREQDARRELIRRCYLDGNGDYIANPPRAQRPEGARKAGRGEQTFQCPAGQRGERRDRLLAVAPQIREWHEASGHPRRLCFAVAAGDPGRPGWEIPQILRRRRGSLPRAGHFRARHAGADHLPPELMFDSMYHLNAKGRAQRTAQLAAALAPLVKERFPPAAPPAR